LFFAVGWVVVRWIARAEIRARLDPAKLAISALSLCLLLSAVRFLWLGIFPLLLLAQIAGAPIRRRGRHSRAALRHVTWIAAAACLLAAGFVKLGERRLVARDGLWTRAYYERPYAAAKYYAHAIWLLADSGVRGNLYHDYFIGGFAGYWLAPDVRSLVNGTLNVSRETLDALGAIAQHKGLRPGEEFTALLDRLGIDLFLGIRLPEPPVTAAAGSSTTAHLESTPGWVPIFRNLTCALYLRANERNRANLDRLARYYADHGVPFDRERGFDAGAVIRDAPDWAILHGVAPHGFVRMEQNTASGRAASAARDRVAMISAVLGRYERALAIDSELLRAEPQAARVPRRIVWSLLRLGRFAEATAAAERLQTRLAPDPVSAQILATARGIGGLDPEAARAAVARLPLLLPGESAALIAGIEPPEPRPAR
jgi:hypothetical protein